MSCPTVEDGEWRQPRQQLPGPYCQMRGVTGIMRGMSGTESGRASTAVDVVHEPVVADVEGVRLRLHARERRGSLTLVEVARRTGLDRDELRRLEKGETTQVRFSTLAKLLAVYDCALEDLVTVERVEQESPLYAAALAALVDGTLPESGRRRRAVRRGASSDSISEGEESAFAASGSSPSRRRRAPVGTLHP